MTGLETAGKTIPEFFMLVVLGMLPWGDGEAAGLSAAVLWGRRSGERFCGSCSFNIFLYRYCSDKKNEVWLCKFVFSFLFREKSSGETDQPCSYPDPPWREKWYLHSSCHQEPLLMAMTFQRSLRSAWQWHWPAPSALTCTSHQVSWTYVQFVQMFPKWILLCWV